MILSPGWAAPVGALLGTIIGSFLATVLVRWPRGESALRGRSHCDGCGRPLRPTELVPIASFVLQRGRCKACGAKIATDHLTIETMAAAIGAGALWAEPAAADLAWAVFGWQLLLLAALDWRHRWLPDVLTATLAVTGWLAAVLLHSDLVARLIGAAAGFASLWLVACVYRRVRGRDGMGGGDPKLFGAIGAWLGWQPLPLVLLVASGIGLLAAAMARIGGRNVEATTELPLGTLLSLAAVPATLIAGALMGYSW